MFSHSGVLASSRSASQTFAPELSALIVILRSVGPVISTRRSTRPGRRVGHPPRVVLADVLGLGEEVQRAAGGQLGVALPARASSSSRRRRVERAVQRGQERQRLGREHLVVALVHRVR